ncbi:DHA2 family efflux MFS transporter permease subunit [Actinomadura chibensis]|uniref:DHA2 family efflux MFS transporter permease subunit n=1 Tax=Actinomadura chibensis TaxID=392828 RepID=A0A5D0NKI7_9ACTN|nr:DHA2 family efflux MFS transporter permease subunit [Actinomadura chibensis]TYB44973.1 DHA2 family efflux MFS transporter permease subunit [Actinomadura chibensis]
MLLVVSLGSFMTLLDLTITNIAVPAMIADLRAPLPTVLWVLNSYTLVLAVGLITGGRLGDWLGSRALLVAGTAVFTLASLLCGVAPNGAVLIAARAVQGLGAALLMPQAMALIVATFPAGRRGTALGAWNAVAGLSMIAGPTLGGLLVATWGWRWIFLLNVPVGVAVIVLALAVVPEHGGGRRHRFDLAGMALSAAWLGCATFAVIEGHGFHWDQPTRVLFGTAAVLFAAFVLQQWAHNRRRGAEPLVPLSLFRDRNYTITSLIRAAAQIGLVGLFLPMTLYLQSIMGLSALRTGLVMAPAALAAVAALPTAGWLTDRIGGKHLLLTGLLLFATGLGALAAVTGVDTAASRLVPAFVITGLGAGCLFAPTAALALHNVEPRVAGAASGVMNTVRHLGSVVGGATVGALLQARLAVAVADQVARQGPGLPSALRADLRRDLVDAARRGALRLSTGAHRGVADLPPGTPRTVSQSQGQGLTDSIIAHGYLAAMHQTLVLPIAVLLLGAVSCLFIQTPARTP